MKRALHLLLGVVLFLTVFFLSSLSLPVRAHAAPAICYSHVTLPVSEDQSADKIARAGVARTVDCSTLQYFLNLPIVNGSQQISAFKADHCYVEGEFSLFEMPPDNAGMSCAALAEWANTTNSTPTKCYSFAADSLSSFNKQDFAPALLKNSDCTSAYKKAYKDKLSTDMPTNQCIVFDQKNDFKSMRCGDLEAIVVKTGADVSAQAEQQTASTCDITKESATCKVSKDQVITDCDQAKSINEDGEVNCDFVQEFINPVIRFLSAGVGFIIVIVIVMSGIRYSASGGDPQKAASARKMAVNAALAFVAYLFLYAVLRWLLPGGLI